MKSSKVVVAQPAVDTNGQPKSWQHQEYGLFYVHFIQFANNDKGEYNSKEQMQNKFVVGQEVDYEFTPSTNPQYPLGKIKPAQKDFQKGGGKNLDNQRSITASYAKEIIIAYINKGDEVKKEWFNEWADHIAEWIDNKVDFETAAKPEVQPTNVSDIPKDDLPF